MKAIPKLLSLKKENAAAAKRRRHLSLVPEPPHPDRPLTRADCQDAPRPCPWASCRHHLMLDVRGSGDILIAFPGYDLDEIRDTCALDRADLGGLSLDEVGYSLNVTKERVRQMERVIFEKIRHRAPLLALLWDEGDL